MTTTDIASEPLRTRIRFDRNELSGAFGDIGTDFPLIVGMILAAHLDPASVLIVFGLMQILTGVLYGMPMPAQPLKAMAVIVITQKLTGNILYGAGLAIGIIMLLLTVTGLIDALARAIPKSVVRGIQFGLGVQLSFLALKDYLPAEGNAGYVLGGCLFCSNFAFAGQSKISSGTFCDFTGRRVRSLFQSQRQSRSPAALAFRFRNCMFLIWPMFGLGCYCSRFRKFRSLSEIRFSPPSNSPMIFSPSAK